MRHVLKSQQFDRPLIEAIFAAAADFQQAFRSREGRIRFPKPLHGLTHLALFYESSTRTRTSFCVAAQHLGMNVIWTENAKDFSSAAKGETIEDTVRVLCEYYPDVITIRHHETGGAERAAAVSTVPIINAGDGRGQHPTQALLDLYTIMRERGRIDGLHVAIGGDLANGRTARSLAYLLAKFKGVSITFVSPESLRIGQDIKLFLAEHGVPFKEESNINRVLHEPDVIYWTRIQKERMPAEEYAKVAGSYRITSAELSQMRRDAVIMHPFPRVDEIAGEVDSDPRAAYFRQAGNGMFVRMALFLWVLEQPPF